MNQREIKSLRSKLARLARNQCAGCDKPCIVQIETDSAIGNVCPYFMKYVLPADPALMNDITERADKTMLNKSYAWLAKDLR